MSWGVIARVARRSRVAIAALSAIAMSACHELPPPRLMPLPYDWVQRADTVLSAGVEAEILPQLAEEVPGMVRDVWGVPGRRVRWRLRTAMTFVPEKMPYPTDAMWSSQPEHPAMLPGAARDRRRDEQRTAFHAAMERTLGATTPSADTAAREWRAVTTELRARGDTVIAIVFVGAGRKCHPRTRTRFVERGMEYALLFLREEDGRWRRDHDIAPFWVRGNVLGDDVGQPCRVPMRIQRAALSPPGPEQQGI